MGDVEERIAEAKRQAEELKAQIETLRNEKNTGGMATASVSPKALTAVIKTRRILKGHFGKVYALHWGGEKNNGTHLVSASQVSAEQHAGYQAPVCCLLRKHASCCRTGSLSSGTP
eukprot:scaffold529_cov308-Pinguiococcus_pyrenoidosus.AAC.66